MGSLSMSWLNYVDLLEKSIKADHFAWFTFWIAQQAMNIALWPTILGVRLHWSPISTNGGQIEIFFKHLKQRLKVSTFVGTSENAVMIQIWTSLIGILLLKYLQKKAKYDWNLSNLAGFIRMNIFVKINIWKWIDDPFIREPIKGENGQLQLFSGWKAGSKLKWQQKSLFWTRETSHEFYLGR